MTTTSQHDGGRTSDSADPSGLDGHVEAADGRRIAITQFGPDAPTENRRLVVASATGVPRRFYAPLAWHAAAAGWHVTTFDYRGIGDSLDGPLRRDPARMSDWGRLDLEAVLQNELPRGRVSLIGHSVAGQILGLAPSAAKLHRVALMGSQSGHWRLWDGRYKLRAWLLWHLMIPGLTPLTGRFPARRFGLGEDLPPNVAKQWAWWGRHRDYLLREWPSDGFHAVRGRVRVLRAHDDVSFAPPRAAQACADWYGTRVESVGEGPMEHFGWFRSGQEREWDGVLAGFEPTR